MRLNFSKNRTGSLYTLIVTAKIGSRTGTLKNNKIILAISGRRTFRYFTVNDDGVHLPLFSSQKIRSTLLLLRSSHPAEDLASA
jgi:hypothetical protein